MPTYRVTDPQSGVTLKLAGDSPPTESELEQIFSQYQPGQASSNRRKNPAFAPPKNVTLRSEDIDAGPAETFLAGAGKGMVDVGRGIGQLVGLVSQDEIDEAKRADAALTDNAAGIAGNIAGGIATLAPAAMIPGVNTATGAALLGAGTGFVQPVATGESRAANTAISAAGGMLGHKIGGALANRMGRKIGNKAARARQESAARQAIDDGFVVPPAHSNPESFTGRILEGLAGKITTAQQAAVKNATKVDSMVRKALGLSDDVPLSRATLNEIRKEAGKEYAKLSNLGRIQADKKLSSDIASALKDYDSLVKDFPTQANKAIEDLRDDVLRDSFDAKSVVRLVRKLRKDANVTAKALGDPAKRDLSKVQRSVANSLEDLLERNLPKGTDLDEFRKARVRIAMSYSVQDALNESTGHVVGQKLGKQLAKGSPLSGDLLRIAQSANAFPKAFQEVSSTFNQFNPLDWAMALFGVGAVGPAGAAGLAARPVARAIALSRPGQKLLALPSESLRKTELAKRALESNVGGGISALIPASILSD